jgi:hypothetical protein
VKRNRIYQSGYVILTVALGLFSRSGYLPDFLYGYLGDALYALMFFFIIGFVFPKFSTIKVALIALSFCFAIEISQFYHAEWIDTIRQTRIGGLVLGFGFLWSDLLSYTFGVITGALLERAVLLKFNST